MSTTTTHLITRVDYVSVPTHNLEAAAHFYGDVLGLERSVYMPERHFAEFETGNLTLNLWDPKGMGQPHVPSANPVALHVADVGAARAVLEREGVAFMGDTLDTGVCHMAFFQDPDANLLMLHHRYAPRTPH